MLVFPSSTSTNKRGTIRSGARLCHFSHYVDALRSGLLQVHIHFHKRVKRGMRSSSRYLGRGMAAGPQVLGTEVPSYRDFPYRAQDVLHLYRDFLRLIYHYHTPDERVDLLFRLRNEFSSKRHLRGPKVISGAIRRGEGILAVQRQILDAKETRQHMITSKHDGAENVDALWEQLRIISGHVLPGLKNHDQSLPVSGGGYMAPAGTSDVRSRRR